MESYLRRQNIPWLVRTRSIITVFKRTGEEEKNKLINEARNAERKGVY
jgi:hypothetical protein